ncbi:tail protein (tape measure) [Citrobacter sedlakii]|uniref:phage tail tape measure protein n=1 Tax=Citrobacter TaxID=544 RepID=UPI001969EF3D|nr:MULTISPECIES: tail protein (tape measure) [Citrobacter]MBM9565820.1 tail protein (tape measure) [Citrobacter sedlakii]HBL4691259.1 tail protein (tape measure) [Citrobacter sedlakii]HBL4706169.1 tail protein (tape measure) [Citrobacter sedlakii]HBL4720447.1 tail protein (tape measure) [Citrobacter sedlakii]HCA7841398.1 tail protein (tape measure) [Citrobacter sedlakii]
MAGEKNAGSIVYEISADVEPLLQGGKQAIDALDKLDAAAQQSGKGMDNLDQSTSQTGSAFTELAGYANSMDNQLRKLNTNVSGIARAMEDARSGTGGASSEFSRAESIIEALGNQLAVLDEAQENGARSAAVLAAQLRAGSKATDEEKQKIGELTGRLFDMKGAADTSMGSNKGWKSSMQQAGYQVQDFIVQVQGGQNALVAFSQQGSQLAGAFGPGGAVVGAVIALSSVIAGILITSLNGGKNAMDALKDAAEAMDKVITVSQNGVAALSDKYANLARVNAEAATILRNQAMIEYNAAIAKIPKSINDASNSIVGFTDKLKTSFVGGIASIDEFNKNLSTVGATADTYSEAMEQARNAGAKFTVNANAIQNTVTTLADKFGVSEQRAFELSKQLSDVANNPTPEALQRLVLELQSTESSTKSGADAIRTFLGPLTELVRVAGEAQINLSGMKKEVDNLTAGQKNLIKQSERNLALSKLQGEARARLQAQYAAEDAGFAKDDPHAKQMEDDAAATYKNTQAQKTLQSTQKKGASQADTIAQKLANLKQQAELAAGSTNELSREQAMLNAEQSLGKGATQAQIAEARQYAAAKWDTANAIKAQAAAEKLLPENAENARYKQDVQDLNTALSAKKISQEQFNQTQERLEATHQANLSKIRAQQAVSPQQEAVGGIDPVQQLANENAKKLALIAQFEQQGLLTHQNALALRNEADTLYEQQRIAAQWEIWRNQNTGNQMLAASFESLAGNASNAFTGILTGSMSAQEAMQSLASNALNSLINGFVQMGVDWVKSAAMGAAAQTSAIATTTAAQTAGLATTTAASTAAATTTMAVWTPAAAVASIGSFGGAAAIGIAALVAAMALAGGLAGKRKNGGPVAAGSMYQVGEGGMPEIYRASTGKQYMIPGDNGRVISNKQMTSGSGSESVPVYINIQNYTGATVDAQASQDGNGVTIDMIVADINQGGRVSQAIQQNHQAPRKARE